MALPVLSEYRTQVRAVLVDAGSLVWADASIDQALRQALGDLNRVYGAAVTIKDLDSATSTTVEAVDTVAVVAGAAGYACFMRAVDLTEMHTLDANAAQGLQGSADRFLGAYTAMCEMVRRRKLNNSVNVPYTVAYTDTQEESDLDWD